MRWFKFLPVVLLILLLQCAAAFALEEENREEGEEQDKYNTIKRIVFISVKGLTESRLKSAYTPNLNGLAAIGIKAGAIGVLPMDEQVFTVSLLTGSDPSVHGFTGAGRQAKIRSLPEILQKYGHKTVITAGAGAIPDFLSKGDNGGIQTMVLSDNDNQSVVKKAIQVLDRDRPFFLLVSLPGVEAEAGRLRNSKEVARAVNKNDEMVGKIFSALRFQGVFEETMIIVVGSNFTSLDQNKTKAAQSNDLMVPVFMKGPGLKSGTALPPVKIIDIVPTAALLTGIQLPPESNGLVLWNALKPGVGFMEDNLLLKRVKELSEENIRSAGLVYRLIEEKGLVNTEKERVDREKMTIQKVINEKDSHINSLNWKIRFLKMAVLVIVLAMGGGYIVEYIYLRKKFLMF